jgi:integrase
MTSSETRPKRGNGEGLIREHPTKKLFEARYTGADGRVHSLYAKTRKKVADDLRAALTAADAGIKPVGQRLTVAVYLEDWLTTSVALRCRPRTVESYRETVTRYISPAIGRVGLAKLDPPKVARMLADLTAAGKLSPTTVRYVYAVLRIALGRALKQGLVVRNVATLVDPPAKATTEMHPLSADQARAFVASLAGDRFRALYIAAIGTGLRQGELLGLTWADVDFRAGTMSVRHSLQRGTRTLADPKTDRGRRTLILSATVATALLEHRGRQRVVGPAAYVFTSRKATPLDARNVTRAFQAALSRAGLPHQRFHDLRHAYATLMLEDGEELATVSRSLGHADLSTTADVYGHVTPAMLQRSADRMDGILGRRASG